MADQLAADPIAEALGELPDSVALYLRDVIHGLEVEAGNARALSREIQAELDSDIARLRLFAAGLRSDLAAAVEQRDLARQESVAALAELAAARADLAALQTRGTARRGWVAR